MSTKKATKLAENAATPALKRRRVKVQPGQLVGIPLRDGSFGLAHVAAEKPGITCAVFPLRAPEPDALAAGASRALERPPIAVMTLTPNRVTDGSWPVVGFQKPEYATALLDTKGRSYTAGSLEQLLDAYHGLQPWDEMADPRYYETCLLPGVPVPSTVRYKQDFALEAQAITARSTSTPGEDTPPAITEGPGVIHIEIKYKGDGLPSMELLHRRQAIEDGLEAAGVGEVTDAGGGGGVMDICLETKDVAHAMPFVHAAIKAAGFEKDARIEVEPTSGDGDDSEEQDDH